jgi:hypothetical protein
VFHHGPLRSRERSPGPTRSLRNGTKEKAQRFSPSAYLIELHASRHAETGTFVTFIYEKDSEQLLWHVTGSDEDEVILQSMAWSEKNSRHHPFGVPKFASNDRQPGTPEENKAAVKGSIAYFGSYSVSETDKTFTIQIEGAYAPELDWNR